MLTDFYSPNMLGGLRQRSGCIADATNFQLSESSHFESHTVCRAVVGFRLQAVWSYVEHCRIPAENATGGFLVKPMPVLSVNSI